MTDCYSWRVEYRDGRMFTEADADAQGGAWGLVEIQNVKALILDPVAEGGAHHLVMVPEGATALFFRRRNLNVLLNEITMTISMIGYELYGQRSMLWVWDSGQVAMTDRDIDLIA